MRGDATQGFEVSASGRNASHVADYRFDDHGGDLVSEFLEGMFEGVGVVEGQRESELGEFLRNARGTGNAKGSNP